MPPLRDSPPDSPFVFSRAERRFAVALVALALVGYAAPYWLPAALGPGEPLAALSPAEMAAFQAEIDAWTAEVDAIRDSTARARAARDSGYAARRAYYAARDRRRTANGGSGFGESRRRERPLVGPPLPAHSVDPNRADSATLVRTGLPHYVVARLLKYRAKAGGFRASDDLAKLYGLSPATFARARAYLLDGPLDRLGTAPPAEATFVSNGTPAAGEPPNAEPPNAVVVNVNEASEADLTAVRGIGPFYARQILDYRDRLGGFTSVAQVAETPKLRDGAFAQWAPQLTVGTGAQPFARLPINDLDARALARHPYVPYTKAATLVAYRDHHGPYRAVSDLYDVVALDSALVARLAPYLAFGE